MKNREKIRYVCQECGYETLQYLGRCPECGKWNTIVEERKAAGNSVPVRSGYFSSEVKKIEDITSADLHRYDAGMPELDALLCGGVVDGQMVLVGGEPGVGKSTLFMQLAGAYSKKFDCLYISGEESLSQVKMRASRLGVDSGNLYLASETMLSEIIEKIKQIKPKFLFIDSIQTIFKEDIPSAPGSVSQVRECVAEILSFSKSAGIITFICGHVTKEGTLAGPRVLEHLVDTVMYFESAKYHTYRILRCFKNRFGSVNEIGVFEMLTSGLNAVKNPSEIFIAQKPAGVPGSVVTCVIEGARPILLEIQALVSPSPLPVPRRQFSGIDYNRAVIIIAVLEKRLGMRLASNDIFINVAGGIKTDEPSTDLAVACAISSAYGNFAIPSGVGIIGEVGLTGEVRSVTYLQRRLSEFEKLGLNTCVIPDSDLKSVKPGMLKIISVKSVSVAIEKIKINGSR
ncbi:MAG: hypothetical protein BWY26_01173 [Elusimicrobia bacterium ADurb.Bin231]|nr:MAG: hypothetical protein BWY26_01173 [Elusimicrobia bacterium ADurb.Bin231]